MRIQWAAALGQVGDVVALAVQPVGGHDGVVQVVELVEQSAEAGDLLGGGVGAGVLVGGGQDVPGGDVAGA